jgi:hypothetical protein
MGYLSVFATLPALLFSNLHEARMEEIKTTDATVPEGTARSHERFNAVKSSELLKRQSRFRLPHQTNFNQAAGDNDNCPGRPIAGGIYTDAAPYIENGDTTGANNSLNSFYCYFCFYLTVDSPGPDHIYSFILTDRGPNPKIEVSSSSGAAFSPLIYVLEGGYPDACPAGTGRFSGYGMTFADGSPTATINSQSLQWLPLNRPLHLVVDSRTNAGGSYTLKLQDVTIAQPVPNPIEDTGFFVTQQYLDFLGRNPDRDGLRFWVNEITSCGDDQACIEVKRINDSGAFFLSIEFQQIGYLAYRAHKAAYGNRPNSPVPIDLFEFWDARWVLGQGVVVNQTGWQQVLENNKQKFFNNFVQTQRFRSAHPTSLRPAEFVDRLIANTGATPTFNERSDAIAEFSGAASTSDFSARARSVRRVAELSALGQQEFNRAFVLMQYFGYLRRNPNAAPDGDFSGFNFWLDKLDHFNGDFVQAEMVKAFLQSSEYRGRFGDK